MPKTAFSLSAMPNGSDFSYLTNETTALTTVVTTVDPVTATATMTLPTKATTAPKIGMCMFLSPFCETSFWYIVHGLL